MKNSVQSFMWKVLLALFVVYTCAACGEMLDDPTIDKDTGEDITLLIVDFNFFKTHVSYKLIDAADKRVISKAAKIWFTGKNAGDIVNYAGEKNADYLTSEGQMELTVDPNVTVSASSPLEYAVHVEVDGYQAFSQGIQINSEGKKTFELFLVKESQGEETTSTGEEDGDSFVFSIAPFGIKSAHAEEVPFEIKYRITKSDLLKFKDPYGNIIFSSEEAMMDAYRKDPEHFLLMTIKKDRSYPLIVDRMEVEGSTRLVSLKKLETGLLENLMLGQRKVSDLNGGVISQSAAYIQSPMPDLFGFSVFDANKASWSLPGTSFTHNKLYFSYTLVGASLEPLCETGASITFASNMVSGFSIGADFYDAKGNLIKTTIFKGNFPETFALENVPAGSASLVFRNNNPAFKPIENLAIENLCSGSYEVDVDAAEGYEGYQIVLKALCPSSPSVAVAPTYSAEIRIKNSNDPWQGIDMISGKADIMAKPGQEYELRLLWEGKWESSVFGTEFDAQGNYINRTASKVSSESMEDGRTRIRIEHEFDQDICDDMDW